MSNLRDLWYDWLGLNTWLFKQINSLSDIPLYNGIMQFITIFGDKKMLPYIISAIAIFAIVSFIIRVVTRKGGNSNFIFLWFNIFVIMGAGLAANYYTITYIKDHFSYPRPYIALLAADVIQLEAQTKEKANQSFPSGHVAIITILIVALWPILGENFRWGGIWLIFTVAWSRMALGVHFPMDVLSGFAISLFQMIIIRKLLFTVYSTIHLTKELIARIKNR